MGADRISPKAFIQEEKTDRRARRSPPKAACRQARNGQTASPLIGVKRPEIRFLHENSKSVPAGSNPSKRHRADGWIIAPVRPRAFQGPFNPRLRAQLSALRASHRRE